MAEYGEPLSQRETEVLELVATGATNRQIARDLVVSVNTVKVHLRNIFTKLGVESRTEATMIAIREGLVSVPEIDMASILQGDEPDEEYELLPGEKQQDEQAAEALPDVQVPFPWPKRVALVLGLVLAVLATAATWPRSQTLAVPADPGTDNLLPGANMGNLAAVDSKWQAMAPMGTDRSRFALVATPDDQLFAIGGETNGGVTASVERFDPALNQWTLLNSGKPTRVSNIGGAAIGDWIYIPGGRTADGAPTAVVEAFHWREETWKEVSALPRALYAYALAVHQEQLYIFGGIDERGYTNAVFVYDPSTDQWREGAEMPTKRAFAAAATLGKRIFVVGGYDGRREHATCEVYHSDERTWKSCKSLMLGRGGLGLVAVTDRLFAVGGGWSSYLAFNERYDPRKDEWTPLETPVGRQWLNLAVASRPDRFYVAGGWNGDWLNGAWEYEVVPYRIHIPIAP